MNELEIEKNVQKAADERGKYVPPKLTVISLDKTASAVRLFDFPYDGLSGYDASCSHFGLQCAMPFRRIP